MIVKPSIAFNEFSGTAKDVTARVVGGRTVLNGRATQSKIKTPKQSARRAKFSYITKQYKTLSAEQLAQWSSLAAAHKEKALTGNGTPLTAHNLFVCLNTNRSLVGVEMTKDAPADIHGSSYISYDDIWITPTQMIITGLSEPDSPTSRLVVKLAVSERKGTSRSKWDSTVVMSSFKGSDWGDVDMLSAYTSEFNVPIVVGHTYYLEMYWIDENSGYVSQVTRAAVTATEGESLHGETYVSRTRMTMSDIVPDEESETTLLDYELSPGSKMVSNDIVTERKTYTYVAGVEIPLRRGLPEELDDCFTYQWGRGTADFERPYAISLMEVHPDLNFDKCLNVSERGGTWCYKFETFGTYVKLRS